MASKSDGAPLKRPDKEDDIEIGAAVSVTRVESAENLKGIVRDIRRYDGHTRVVVEGHEREVNVADDQVDALTGVDATMVKDIIGETDV